MDLINLTYPTNPTSSSYVLFSRCSHGIAIGACWMCQQAWNAAAAKRRLLLNPIVIPWKPAFSNDIANCEHKWRWISDDGIMKVACDFGLPVHEIQTGLASYCQFCFAVSCLDCA